MNSIILKSAARSDNPLIEAPSLRLSPIFILASFAPTPMEFRCIWVLESLLYSVLETPLYLVLGFPRPIDEIQ